MLFFALTFLWMMGLTLTAIAFAQDVTTENELPCAEREPNSTNWCPFPRCVVDNGTCIESNTSLIPISSETQEGTQPFPTTFWPIDTPLPFNCSVSRWDLCPLPFCYVDAFGQCVDVNTRESIRSCHFYTEHECPTFTCLSADCPPPECEVDAHHCISNEATDWCDQFAPAFCPALRCNVNSGACVSSVVTATPQPTVVPQSCRDATSAFSCSNFNSTQCQWIPPYCMDLTCSQWTRMNECLDSGCHWASAQCNDSRWFSVDCDSLPQDICRLRQPVCVVHNSVCQDGATSVPAEALTSCGDIVDWEECDILSSCQWLFGLCDDAPCNKMTSFSSCPLTRCLWDSQNLCRTPCPPSAPYFCQATKLCAPSEGLCGICSTAEISCWDSSCVASYDRCPCPERLPIRCSDGKCAASRIQCNVTCLDVLCWDHSCASSIDRCPCPPSAPISCGGGRCVADGGRCSTVPSQCRGTQCWDMSCAASDVYCPCTRNHPFRCLVDGLCYDSVMECPCEISRFRCPDGSCAESLSLCSVACTKPNVKCRDGSCKAHASECPCDATSPLQIRLSTVEAVVSPCKTFHIAATATLHGCGIPASFVSDVVWTILLSGSSHQFSSQGSILTFLPGSLQPRSTYVVTASVNINSGTSNSESRIQKSANATATIRVGSQDGQIVIETGDVHLRHDNVLTLMSRIVDGCNDVPPSNVKWQCCRANSLAVKQKSTSACGADCPAPYNETSYGFGYDLGSRKPVLPEGQYLIKAMHGVSFDMVLVNITSPSNRSIFVRLSLPPLPHSVGKSFTAYALFSNPVNMTSGWIRWCFGRLSNGQSDEVIADFSNASEEFTRSDGVKTVGKLIVLPPATLERYTGGEEPSFLLRAVVTSHVSAASYAGEVQTRISLVPAQSDGHCTIHRTQDPDVLEIEPNAQIIGGRSMLRLLAVGWNHGSPMFKAGYFRNVTHGSIQRASDLVVIAPLHTSGSTQVAGMQYIELSSVVQHTSEFLFVAPFVGTVSIVTFVVRVSYGKQQDIAFALCNAELHPPAGSAEALLKDAIATVERAMTLNDSVSVFRAAHVVADVLRDGNVSNSTAEVMQILQYIDSISLEQRATLSSSERGIVVQLLSSMRGSWSNENAAELLVLSILHAVLDAAALASECQLDVKEYGSDVLDILVQLRNRSESFVAVESNFAQIAAKSMAVGERIALSSSGSSLTGQRITLHSFKTPVGDMSGLLFGSSNASVVLNRLFDEDFEDPFRHLLTLTAAEFAQNPVGDPSEPPANDTACNWTSGPVVSISLLGPDGARQEIKNLTHRFTVVLRVDCNDMKKVLRCAYWDAQMKNWSRDGAVHGATDGTACTQECLWDHFGLFAVVVSKQEFTPEEMKVNLNFLIGLFIGAVLLMTVFALFHISSRSRLSRALEEAAMPLNRKGEGLHDSELLALPRRYRSPDF